MKPSVSLITVSDARPDRVVFHADLVSSVAHQNPSLDIEWVWVISDTEQAHGAVSNVARSLRDVPHVTVKAIAHDENLPVGARRNLALDQVTTDFVTNLDDDDVLIGGLSLSLRGNALLEEKDVKWSTGHIVDLYPGYSKMWAGQLPSGTYDLDGDFYGKLFDTEFNVSIHSGTILSRVETLQEVGGWDNELPQAEDIALTMKLATLVEGRATCVPAIVYGYRKHPSQMTKDSGFSERDKVILEQLRKRYPPVVR